MQAAERALFHLLRVAQGPAVQQQCGNIASIDSEALGNFVSRTLSKMEASDDEEAD